MLDIHKELEAIKSRVPTPLRQAAYQQLVTQLEAAKAQATLLQVQQRYSVLVHYVKAKAREDRAWSLDWLRTRSSQDSEEECAR